MGFNFVLSVRLLRMLTIQLVDPNCSWMKAYLQENHLKWVTCVALFRIY